MRKRVLVTYFMCAVHKDPLCLGKFSPLVKAYISVCCKLVYLILNHKYIKIQK